MHPATRNAADAQAHPRVPFRIERAVTAGLLCGPGGAAAHVLAGGAAPSAGLLALVTLAALGGALAVLGLVGGRHLGWLVLLGLAGGAQLVFHHLLGSSTPAAAHGGHGHAAMSDMSDMSGMSGHDATTMLLGHLAVAVLVAAVARGAESSWCAMARSALARLVPLLPETAVTVVEVVRVPRRPATQVVARPEDVVLEVVGPRGPPPRRASVTLAA